MNDCTRMVDNHTLLAVLAAGRAQRFGGANLTRFVRDAPLVNGQQAPLRLQASHPASLS